jgi:hypothetical protein
MAKLHVANCYDCLTHDVEALLGRPATSARDLVARHDDELTSCEQCRGVEGAATTVVGLIGFFLQ